MKLRSLAAPLLATVLGASVALPASQAQAATPDKTSAVEAKRVDSVPTPKLDWFDCYGQYKCATAKLPLDYDQPKGATTEVALVKVSATDQAHKIGTLFVNPGGPGGSATQMAAAMGQMASPLVKARFDIVGVDPRGVAFTDNVRCFTDLKAQSKALTGLDVPFPVDEGERAAYLKGAANLGKGCATTGKALASAASTAEVARDMDVLRRAVGDKKLTYLGFSYGTYLGQVYANMFPDRVRAVAVDGTLDPAQWAGSPATQGTPVTLRIGSAQGAWSALKEAMKRCDAVGPEYCALAGNAQARWTKVARELVTHPIYVTNPFSGQNIRFGYAEMISNDLSMLYGPDGPDWLTMDTYMLEQALFAPNTTQRSAALKTLNAKRMAYYKSHKPSALKTVKAAAFPYDNGLEAFTTVLCTDSLNPASPNGWNSAVQRGVRNGGGPFAAAWGWASAPCATNTWKAVDEDAYRGPWNKKTASTVLVVGSLWDPATSYASAKSATALLGNARLLSSDNWGHTAYGTSSCATQGIESYLVYGYLPKAGTMCKADYQPFTQPLTADDPAEDIPAGAQAGVQMAPKPDVKLR